MKDNQKSSRSFREGRSIPAGFTLVESVLSIVIVSVVLVASLSVAGSARRSERFATHHSQGRLLAEGLMNEILQQPYEDLDDTPIFGIEANEPGDSNRDAFDDIDDYQGWTADPPEVQKGNKTIAPDGWARTVTIEWLDPADMSTVSGVETGMKRIKVAITYNDNPVSELVAIRTNAWPVEEEEELPGGNPPHILFLADDKTQITLPEQAHWTCWTPGVSSSTSRTITQMLKP